MTRREFIRTTGAAAAVARMPHPAAAKYDLLVKGGRVIDPAQRIDRVADVAIRGGRIVAVQPNIAASEAAEMIEAAGRIVTPGLVDLHVHATEDIPAFALSTGVTTMLDAGTKGADGVADRVDMVKRAPNRVRVLLNLSTQGVTTPGELLNFDTADVEAAKRAIDPHRDVIVGVKARLSRSVAGDHDLDAVRLAKAVTAAFKLPLMVHIGDSVSPLPKILELLDRGDIVTHLYAPINGILDGNGRVWPQVLEARRRGIVFDFGNGRLEHFTWESVERGVQQRFLPDTHLVGSDDRRAHRPRLRPPDGALEISVVGADARGGDRARHDQRRPRDSRIQRARHTEARRRGRSRRVRVEGRHFRIPGQRQREAYRSTQAGRAHGDRERTG